MQNKYRLRANQYDRETEDEKIRPYRIYYIAVEGNATEKEYFEGLSAYRENLGIHGIVSVEVLQRSSQDGHSAPKQVLELLEEYISLRNNGIANELSDDDFSSIVSEYGMDFIKRYIENPNSVPIKKRNRLVTKLLTVGYDINYRRYLTITGNNDSASENDDVFCIMIDRDAGSHTPEELQFCLNHCREKSYKCFIATPCFEFWLLLHLSDVKSEYADKLDFLLANPKVSEHHTFVSKEVSQKAHHGKHGLHFKNVYLPHVMDAVQRAKEFAVDDEDLIDHLGCNLWELIEEMQQYQNDQ